MDCVYTFGVDSRWFQSTNNLAYTNNLKMKISVILAILQMSLGICMKGFNAIHFKRPLDFIFEFVPQIILILALFGWMDILIISKWLFVKHIDTDFDYPDLQKKPYPNPYDPAYTDFNNVHYSPPIITTMIDIFLNGAGNEKVDESTSQTVPKYLYVLDGQKGASIALVLIAFICVPLMLCVKPFVLKSQLKNHGHGPHVHVESESIQYDKGSHIEENPKAQAKNEVYGVISAQLEKMGSGGEHHAFSEIFIH